MNTTLKNLLTAVAAEQKTQNDQRYVIEGEYSPNTRVGTSDTADNLETSVYQSNETPFSIQPSGGSADIITANDGALLRELRGNSIVLNQNFNISNITGNKSTLSINDNVVTCTCNGTDQYFGISTRYYMTKGHKYYITYNITDINFEEENVSFEMPGMPVPFSRNPIALGRVEFVADVSVATTAQTRRLYFNAYCPTATMSINDYFRIKDIHIVDLTLTFGVGKEPTTVEEFKKRSPYAYNYRDYIAGQIISANATSITSYSANLYTEEQFKVIGGEDYAIDGVLACTIKEYDSNNNLIKETVYSSLGTVYALDNTAHAGYATSTIKGIRLDSNTVSVYLENVVVDTAAYFGLAWSKPYKGDKTHIKEVYPLGNDILHSALNAYDIKTPDGTITRNIGVYTITAETRLTVANTGTADKKRWGIYSLRGLVKNYTDNNSIGNIICDKYASITANNTYYTTNGISGNSDGQMFIYDDVYSGENDGEAFLQHLIGTVIYYEKLTPTTEQGTSYQEAQYVNDYGIQDFDTVIPQGAKFLYQVNLKDYLQRLYNNSDGNPSEYVLQSELNSALANLVSKPTIVTDTTSTDITVTLAPNSRYNYGTLNTLNITFPATANDGDEIVINFVSTATTLTRDTTNAIYNFDSIGSNVFVELNAEYKVSIGKWVVISAETEYSV